MTIPGLHRAITEQSGLLSEIAEFDAAQGECRIEVMDADKHNRVMLRFPYQALDDDGLPGVLIALYFQEMGERRQGRLGSKKKRLR